MSNKNTTNSYQKQVSLNKYNKHFVLEADLINITSHKKPVKRTYQFYALYTEAGKDLLKNPNTKDTLKFTKIYNEVLNMIIETLSGKGIRLLFLIVRLLKTVKDSNVVCLDSEIMELHNKHCKISEGRFNRNSFRAAKNELIKHDIMRNQKRMGRTWFEVNPNMIYSGDRKKAKSNFKVLDLVEARKKLEEIAM